MTKIQTFVIAHTPELVQKTLTQFGLPNLKVCAVSLRDFSAFADNPKVIVCKDLTDNIEDNPGLLHLTAFYAVAKNGLLDPEATHVRWLEYDVDFSPGYARQSETICETSSLPIFSHLEEVYRKSWDNPAWLVTSIRQGLLAHFGENLKDYPSYARGAARQRWICTLNFIMKREVFLEFFDFVSLFRPYLENDPKAGHSLERLLTVFAIHNGYDYQKIDGLKHFWKNSHGTY